LHFSTCAFYIKKASCPATWQDASLYPHVIYPSYMTCGCARTLSASQGCFKGTCIQFCLLLSRLLHEMSTLFLKKNKVISADHWILYHNYWTRSYNRWTNCYN